MTYSPIDPLTRPRVVGYWSVAITGTTSTPDKAVAEAARPWLEEAQRLGLFEAWDGRRLWRFTAIDPDPRYVEPLPETGRYDEPDEPPRRISVALYVLGALFLVTALLVLWAVKR